MDAFDKMNELVAERGTYQDYYLRSKRLDYLVDVCEPDGYLQHAWEECISSGTAYLYITPEKDYAKQILAQLKDVHDNLGFKRVYFDKVNAYEPKIRTYFEDEKGRGVYDWRQVDEVYDKLLAIGVSPFVMISAMPKALASDPDNTAFDGGNSSAPKDYGKWKEYCRAFILHLNERYGYEEVGTWYIQVFNEPDIVNGYWSGTQEEFFRTYDFAATAVREANGKARVGPGGFAFSDGHLLAAFIDHVTSGNDDPAGDPAGAPFDFINTHGYHLSSRRRYRDDFDRIDRYMVSHFGPNHDKALLISEWNTIGALGYNPHSNNGAFCAAYLVRQIAECTRDFFSDPAKVRFFAYWTHSDVFDEYGAIESEFSNLYGIITPSGIRKAGYNGFKMLHELGFSRIRLTGGDATNGGLATYNRDRIVVVLYNCDYDVRRTEGDSLQERDVHLRISNIPWARVEIRHYRIDNVHSNAYRYWVEMGSPKECSPEQVEELKGKMDLESFEEARICDTVSGEVESDFSLPMPGVSMFVVIPVVREFQIDRTKSHYVAVMLGA